MLLSDESVRGVDIVICYLVVLHYEGLIQGNFTKYQSLSPRNRHKATKTFCFPP